MNKATYISTSIAAEENLQVIGLVKGAALERENKMRRSFLRDYSTISVFADDTWIIDKKELGMNLPDNVRRLKFNGLGPVVKDTVKDWALEQLLIGRKLKGINSSLSAIKSCLRLVPGKDAKELDSIDIMTIYDELFNGKKSISASVYKWSNLKCFLETVGCTDQESKMAGYDIPYVKRKKCREKYIPASVQTKLDIVFLGEQIPLTYRCIYWTLRLIPNRIEEVCSIKLTALKKIYDDRYLLTIHINKSAGNFEELQEKHIQIIYTGIGKYYVDLIKKQIEFTKKNAPNSQFLFVTRKVCYMRNLDTGKYEYRETGKKLYAIHEKKCFYFFGKLGKYLDIRDETGKIVNITTHKFRHTGSTDRLESGIFRQIDVMYLTGHSNTAMINQNYSHMKEPEKREGFRGMIGDERRMAMILKRPYAKELYHLGVCIDARECSGDKIRCLACESLEIDEGAVPFMIRDYRDWKEKQQKAEKIGNEAFAEYCSSWIEAYSNLFIRLRIKKEDYDGDEENTVRCDERHV